MDFLQVPLVAASVIAPLSGGLVAKDIDGSLCEQLEHKSDYALRKSHEALALRIRQSATSSLYMTAFIIWVRKLVQLFWRRTKSPGKVPVGSLEWSNWWLLPLWTYCTLRPMLRPMEVAARRSLWLRAWWADHYSKIILESYSSGFRVVLFRLALATKGFSKNDNDLGSSSSSGNPCSSVPQWHADQITKPNSSTQRHSVHHYAWPAMDFFSIQSGTI